MPATRSRGQDAPERSGERQRSRLSTTGVTRSAISASAASTPSSAPPKAKQSSLSCAIVRSRGPSAQMIRDERGDRRRIVERQQRHRRGERLVAWRPRRSWGRRDRAAACRGDGRCTSIFGCGWRLKPSTSSRSTGRHPRHQLVEARLRASRSSCIKRPAPRRGDHDLARAGLAVPPGILAGPVDVEFVMGVLDRRHGEAARRQLGNQRRQQRGLAAAAPAGKPEDPHSWPSCPRLT